VTAAKKGEASGGGNEGGGDKQCWKLMRGTISGDNKRASGGDNA